jgi:cysteine-rich repeat protein
MRKLLSMLLLVGNGALVACQVDVSSAPRSGEIDDCTRTQGYWQNPGADDVVALELGSVAYTADQLAAILDEPVAGNGLVSLAHQLIAAKLNIAVLGADDSDIADEIAAADALIGALVVPPVGDGHLAPGDTSALVDALAAFNEGPGACAEEPFCGDGDHDAGEECDDGNNEDGDGCSADCRIEQDDPFCGDGQLDQGEACDDGADNSDSEPDACRTDCTLPVCGDHVVDRGEECDGGPGCTDECTLDLCGNGVVDDGEECDHAAPDAPDGCSLTCELVAPTPFFPE